MIGLLLLALVAMGIVIANLRARLKDLSARIDRLERQASVAIAAPAPPVEKTTPSERPLATAPPPAAAKSAVTAVRQRLIKERVSATDGAHERPASTAKPPAEPAWSRPGLESLIGARLPVWIGAVALIAAGFFLVRYAIESGLLGPGVRTFAAGLFALALIAASEAVRRLPATADDPRIGQALAGAGIASAYGALYLAAALYHLVAPLPAFIVMLGVTALALFLALRHGPPTAVLALAGGFAAPLVAGYDAAGIAPLLVYLALFTAALFALAIHRGWAWLAIAATVAGFGWINFLLVVLTDGHGSAAAFAVVLAIAASVVLPRVGVASPWLRLAPLVAGLVQLLAFAPAMDFGALAWAMYLTLAGATLFLAWRDDRYLPGAIAAMVLALALVVTGTLQADPGATAIGAVVAALMFGGAGLALLDRARGWSVIALGGVAGPLLIANALQPDRMPDWQWGGLALVAAALAAFVSTRRRAAAGTRDFGLMGGALLAALLWSVAWLQLLPDAWLPVAIVAAVGVTGWWAKRTGDTGLLQLPALGLLAALFAGGSALLGYLAAIGQSLAGGRLPFLDLPPRFDGLRLLLPIAAATLWLRTDPRMFGRWRTAALIGGIGAGVVLAWHLAKLPLGIASDPAFVQWGFIERALITQAFLGAGWWIARQPAARAIGISLFGLGLARVLWFDLLALNPIFEAQQVGSIPLLNAAVLHLAAVAAWSWTLVASAQWRRAGMVASLFAVLALVRQAAHGTILTGPIGTGENYGYSAALLLLALGWLGLGIRSESRELRVAGLALLTLVTLKVFLIDAAALGGLLRILSFLGLGVALIGISWVYGRFLGRPSAEAPRPKASVADN